MTEIYIFSDSLNGDLILAQLKRSTSYNDDDDLGHQGITYNLENCTSAVCMRPMYMRFALRKEVVNPCLPTALGMRPAAYAELGNSAELGWRC